MNGVPEDLPEALLDRFPVKINIDTVHPSALDSLPEKFRSVYADYNNGAFSIRRWIALGELLDKEVNLE